MNYNYYYRKLTTHTSTMSYMYTYLRIIKLYMSEMLNVQGISRFLFMVVSSLKMCFEKIEESHPKTNFLFFVASRITA